MDEELVANDSSLICLKAFSLWIVDFYFTKIYSQQIKKFDQASNTIGCHDMLSIYRRIQSSSSSSSMSEFWDLCKKKLKQMKNDPLLENYEQYLTRCGLNDIIDLFHQCELESNAKTIILSINSIENDMDRLLLEHLLETSSSCCIYDLKTKATTPETKENFMKFIRNEKNVDEQISSKNHLKHLLCTYLSLLLDTRNEHALIHCLMIPSRSELERQTLVHFGYVSKLSKNECLSIYQILLSFLRRKELILNRCSSSQSDLTNNDNDDDQSFHILDKYYINIKEFFDFIEQLQMIIEDNEHSKIESSVTLRQLLELISKQLRKDKSFHACDLMTKEIIEEFCQCFQTILPLMNCSSPIRSTSSGRCFLRSIAYLCAKQTISLPVLIAGDVHSDLQDSPAFESPPMPLSMVTDQIEVTSSSQNRYQQRKQHRSRQLSTIHETSFDSDSVIDDKAATATTAIPSQSIAKRQPLREIDINSFNNEERPIESEKIRSENSLGFTLVSDGDKENLPVIGRKRSMISTKNDPSTKRQKKTNMKVPEVSQRMITSFFQSTN